MLEITILFGVVCPNMKLLRCFGIGLVLGGSLLGQKADTVTSTSAPAGVGVIHKRTVAAANVYHHIITAVPFTGLGTYRDPRRPMYIPPALPAASDRTGIIAFTFLPSDDGKSAIVEYVAANTSAFSQIYADKTLTIFEKGRDQKAVVEAAMRKYRKSFSLDNFGVTVR